MPPLFWLVLLLIFVGSCYWHVRENAHLKRQWEKNFDPDTTLELLRLAWSRTVQLLVALAGCLLVIAVYDWKLDSARESIKTLQAAAAVKPAPPAAVPVAEHAAPAAPAAESTPRPLLLVAPANQPPAVSDVYSQKPATGDTAAAMDDLKKRYEDMLVIYFFLDKCGRATSSDYQTIMTALAREITSLGAPDHLQADIVTAAQGSYQEIYAGSDCADESTATLYTQYMEYIGALNKQIPAP